MEFLILARQRLANPTFTSRLTQHAANRSGTRLYTQQTSLYHRLQTVRRPQPSLRQTRFPRQAMRRHNSNKPSSEPSPNPTPHLGSPQPTSLSARLKQLSKEYGWTALGVYLGLSALDFPFCYLAVRLLGTDRIGYAEHVVVNGFWSVVGLVVPSLKPSERALANETEEQVREGAKGTVVKDNASVWTQLALAYAVHKSLIFFRVPLTAAVLPKVVKTLRGWGWDIGKKMPKVGNKGSKS